jgi:hypothetical protein
MFPQGAIAMDTGTAIRELARIPKFIESLSICGYPKL